MTYLSPTEEIGRALFSRPHSGPIVMLNLLRFRAEADYSADPHLAPDTPISGAAAYDLYMDHTLPHLHTSGGETLFDGAGGAWFIGPEDERWDRAILIRQASLSSFLAFASDEAYLGGLGHLTAALADSRLLPLVPAA